MGQCQDLSPSGEERVQYREKTWRRTRSIIVGWLLFVSLAAVGVAAADLEKPLKADVEHVESSAQNGSAPHGLISTVARQLILSPLHPQLFQGHVWPDMQLDWRLVLGSVIGFFGAALGSIGGVGGGGIFVPMLTLVIGFDAKSSTAISKCMIMGAAASTVYYNLPLKHPTLDLPIIDYDLALLFQPMLMLGISIGVAFNVIFADWMVTLLLIALFLVTSTRAFFKGIETWRKETIMKKEATLLLESSSCSKLTDDPEMSFQPFANSPSSDRDPKLPPDFEVSVLDIVYWRELALLLFVWVAFLLLQIVKTYAPTCSVDYWVLNSLQVPIAVGATVYEGVCLYTGRRVIASRGPGRERMNWKAHQLFLYCCCGILAGVVGGLLGLGGGFILGPLFLELGLPPQVASATSTFVMTFSASMSVAQNYLLNRFPIGYAAYFILIATMAAVIGQHVVRKLVALFGRASLIIFILSSTIFISAVSLGSVGISDMVGKLERHEHMGFESLC